jgi:hypothetical protein
LYLSLWSTCCPKLYRWYVKKVLATSFHPQHLLVAYAPNMYLIHLWPFIFYFTFWATFMTWHSCMCGNGMAHVWHLQNMFPLLKMWIPTQEHVPIVGNCGKMSSHMGHSQIGNFWCSHWKHGDHGETFGHCWFIFQPSCQLSCTHKGMYAFQSRMHIHVSTWEHAPLIREHMFPIVIAHFTFGHIKEPHNNLHFFAWKTCETNV